jgi:hypothetical protein
MNLKVFKVVVFTSILLPLCSVAQELSPRSYWPAPVGTRVATVGYSHNSGDIVPDRSLLITGVDSTFNSMHIGYRHTMNLWNRTANLTVEVPYTNGSTVGSRDGEPIQEQEYSGLGDLAATLSVNILGAPAMTRQEFREMRRNLPNILGASLKVVAPTGQYDSDQLINVGANRWAMKAEVGYITALHPKWLFEMSLGAWVFENNDDLQGETKEQNPVVVVQGHLIHRFRPGFWASFDVNYYEGGRSTIDGRQLNNVQRDSKIGATLVFPFALIHAIKLGYSNGSITDSNKEFNILQISYQRLF